METKRPRHTTVTLNFQTEPIASSFAMRHRVTVPEVVRAILRYADTFNAVAHGEIRRLLSERTKARLIAKENLIKTREWSAAARAAVEKWQNGVRGTAARREPAARPAAVAPAPARWPRAEVPTGHKPAAKNAFTAAKLKDHHAKYPGGLP